MKDWLEQLFANRLFGLFISPSLAAALSIWLITDFFRTHRSAKRGEPLSVWYLRDPIYPDDPLYRLFVSRREIPAIALMFILFLIIAIVTVLFLYVTFFHPGR